MTGQLETTNQLFIPTNEVLSKHLKQEISQSGQNSPVCSCNQVTRAFGEDTCSYPQFCPCFASVFADSFEITTKNLRRKFSNGKSATVKASASRSADFIGAFKKPSGRDDLTENFRNGPLNSADNGEENGSLHVDAPGRAGEGKENAAADRAHEPFEGDNLSNNNGKSDSTAEEGNDDIEPQLTIEDNKNVNNDTEERKEGTKAAEPEKPAENCTSNADDSPKVATAVASAGKICHLGCLPYHYSCYHRHPCLYNSFPSRYYPHSCVHNRIRWLSKLSMYRHIYCCPSPPSYPSCYAHSSRCSLCCRYHTSSWCNFDTWLYRKRLDDVMRRVCRPITSSCTYDNDIVDSWYKPATECPECRACPSHSIKSYNRSANAHIEYSSCKMQDSVKMPLFDDILQPADFHAYEKFQAELEKISQQNGEQIKKYKENHKSESPTDKSAESSSHHAALAKPSNEKTEKATPKVASKTSDVTSPARHVNISEEFVKQVRSRPEHATEVKENETA